MQIPGGGCMQYGQLSQRECQFRHRIAQQGHLVSEAVDSAASGRCLRRRGVLDNQDRAFVHAGIARHDAFNGQGVNPSAGDGEARAAANDSSALFPGIFWVAAIKGGGAAEHPAGGDAVEVATRL